MGGIAFDDFSQSVAYREIFRCGEALGEAKVTLRQLSRCCGPLSAEQERLIRSLPLERLGPSLRPCSISRGWRISTPGWPLTPELAANRAHSYAPLRCSGAHP